MYASLSSCPSYNGGNPGDLNEKEKAITLWVSNVDLLGFKTTQDMTSRILV
jgi:hypothetical protein